MFNVVSFASKFVRQGFCPHPFVTQLGTKLVDRGWGATPTPCHSAGRPAGRRRGWGTMTQEGGSVYVSACPSACGPYHNPLVTPPGTQLADKVWGATPTPCHTVRTQLLGNKNKTLFTGTLTSQTIFECLSEFMLWLEYIWGWWLCLLIVVDCGACVCVCVCVRVRCLACFVCCFVLCVCAFVCLLLCHCFLGFS